MSRAPAVAGTFYPSDPAALRGNVQSLLGMRSAGEPAIAVLAPHAGYLYSGPCAGQLYGAIQVPGTAIILGPNHTGLGKPLAIMDEGTWDLPLGEARIESTLARRLLALDKELSVDALAHAREHSLEVQLPFLRFLDPELQFVPICVGTHRTRSLLALGEALARAIREEEREVLLVLSSDLSHYLPFKTARGLDALAIEKMVALDAEGLLRVVEEERISMCGCAPVAAGIHAARILGASRGRLIAYTCSGDRTGDYDDVVTYAGIVFS